MRFFLISLFSLLFLSGCGEKDPASGFVGEWKMKGAQDNGLVINPDMTGFLYWKGSSENFTWDFEGYYIDKITTKPSAERGLTRKFSLSGERITMHSTSSSRTWIYRVLSRVWLWLKSILIHPLYAAIFGIWVFRF